MLHHYDAIGLLRPARVNATGCRLYEATQLSRLNRIVALNNLTTRLASVEARLRVIESEGVMPEQEVTIKSLPALRLAKLTAEAESFDPSSISPVIQPLYERLYASLEAAGITPTGPGVAWYEALDGGRARVHAGAQVPASVRDDGPGNSGEFDVVVLPAVEQAATLIHHGVMYNVMPSVQALARWIDANGYTSTGINRKLYLDYGMSDDPSQWVTELQEPVVAAQ